MTSRTAFILSIVAVAAGCGSSGSNEDASAAGADLSGDPIVQKPQVASAINDAVSLHELSLSQAISLTTDPSGAMTATGIYVSLARKPVTIDGETFSFLLCDLSATAGIDDRQSFAAGEFFSIGRADSVEIRSTAPLQAHFVMDAGRTLPSDDIQRLTLTCDLAAPGIDAMFAFTKMTVR